jgi:hypothetical protein
MTEALLPLYQQGEHLGLERCPFCSIAKPSLQRKHVMETKAHDAAAHQFWGFYVCTNCGGVISARSPFFKKQGSLLPINLVIPEPGSFSSAIPGKSREYLQQARDSLFTPAGSVMLSASAIDAMLKDKGYKDGTLFDRIGKAASDHLITEEMSAWAHDVRLDANEQRHADKDASLPSRDDAERALEFAKALAEFLFVLPDRVKRGRGIKNGQ